jgi:GTP-binding protein HflX
MLDNRILKFKRDLTDVRRTRSVLRAGRKRTGKPVIALAGYTNAGKSTLFNRLTGADVFAKDMPFATLDPTIRRLDLPTLGEAALIDTVGFITDLPTHLIESFQATLEEVLEADLIVHVRDRASASDIEQAEDVMSVLHKLSADSGVELPPMMEVWNKADIYSPERREALTEAVKLQDDPIAVIVSAVTGDGVDDLLAAIERQLARHSIALTLTLGPADGKARAWLHEHGVVKDNKVLEDGGTEMNVQLPRERFGQFRAAFPLLAK